MTKPRRNVPPISPTTTVKALASHPILHELTKAQLIVYLRLIAAVAAQRSRRVRVFNTDLLNNRRAAADALRVLERLGMITTEFAKNERTIEVR